MKIVADIGGTHARLALTDGFALREVRKFRVREYECLEDVLNLYLREHGLGEKPALRIATAAYPERDAGRETWRFVNENQWEIIPERLQNAGWNLECIINDFDAATWGLTALAQDQIETLRDAGGLHTHGTKCLIGPGTGLGLGYLVQNHGQLFVGRTHGGHMPIAVQTEEQWLVVQSLQQMKGSARTIAVFENIVSGPGMLALYRALCRIAGANPVYEDAPSLFADLGHDSLRVTRRLFHEFYGLFAATAVVTGHAYGGLYLTGGVMDRLMERGLFDLATFERSFILAGVESVRADLQATPVTYVKNRELALTGLLARGSLHD